MRSGLPVFFGPAPEQLTPAQLKAKARHLALMGTILRRCQNAFLHTKEAASGHALAMEFLHDFTIQYSRLTDSEKNQVTDLIIKSIPDCDIFWLTPFILGYTSTMIIDGLEIEKFPMRAANAILKEFNDCDFWPWNWDKKAKKDAVLRALCTRTEKMRETISNEHNIGASLYICAMLIESYVQSGAIIPYVLLPGAKTALSYNHETSTLCIFDTCSKESKPGCDPFIAQPIYDCLNDTPKGNISSMIPSMCLHHPEPTMNAVKLYGKSAGKRDCRKAITVKGSEDIANFIQALREAFEVFKGKTIFVRMPLASGNPVEVPAGLRFK